MPGPGYRADVAIWRLSSRKVTKVLSFTVGRATRGAYVACGDLDGDGTSEIVVSFDRGVGPEVRVYRVVGTGVTLVTSFLAYEPSFTGGVRVAMADVDGDGLLDVITAPGAGREPVVRALKLSGQTVTELAAFDAEEPGFAGGLYVAGGKRDDLGGAAVMTSPGSGGVPNLRIFSVSPVVVLESTNVIVDDPTGSHGVTLGASPVGRPQCLRDGRRGVVAGRPGSPQDQRLYWRRSPTGPAPTIKTSVSTEELCISRFLLAYGCGTPLLAAP